MARLRRTAGLASAALLTFTLTACGGSDYCDLIDSADDDIGQLSTEDIADPEALGPAADRLQEIANAAPDEVADQWQTMADAFQALVDAEGDMTAIDEETLSDMQTMDPAPLEENVQEECDIELGL